MAFRKRIKNKRRDKRRFSKTAGKMHKKNNRANIMRGGFRL